jgi:hypothetical protein
VSDCRKECLKRVKKGGSRFELPGPRLGIGHWSMQRLISSREPVHYLLINQHRVEARSWSLAQQATHPSALLDACSKLRCGPVRGFVWSTGACWVMVAVDRVFDYG